MHRWQLSTRWEAISQRLVRFRWPFKTVVNIDIGILLCNKAIKSMLFEKCFLCGFGGQICI